MLVIQGFADSHGNGYITKVAPARHPPGLGPAASQFHVRVLSRTGSVLSDTPMRVATSFVHHLGPSYQLSAEVPASGAEAIELRSGDQPLAQRKRPRLAPLVRDVDVHPDRPRTTEEYRRGCAGATAHAMGCDDHDAGAYATEVRWHTLHAESGNRLAKIDFSADAGKTWRPVFFGPDNGRASLDSAMLGISDDARIRVRINDGFNESSAVSPRFHEAGAPPAVRIIAPAPGATLRRGNTVYLQGQAYQSGRVLVPDERLSWYAGDQLLGHGSALSVAALPSGKTTIRFLAHDTAGRSTQRTITVDVIE
jgi:hypothetical protein